MDLLRSIHLFVQACSPSPAASTLLKALYQHQKMVLRNYPRIMVAHLLKTEFLLVKNKILMGVKPNTVILNGKAGVGKGGYVWVKESKLYPGAPRALTPLFSALRKPGFLRVKDQVLVLTLLRSYKQFDIPVPKDLRTVISLQRTKQLEETFVISQDVPRGFSKFMPRPKRVWSTGT